MSTPARLTFHSVVVFSESYAIQTPSLAGYNAILHIAPVRSPDKNRVLRKQFGIKLHSAQPSPTNDLPPIRSTSLSGQYYKSTSFILSSRGVRLVATRSIKYLGTIYLSALLNRPSQVRTFFAILYGTFQANPSGQKIRLAKDVLSASPCFSGPLKPPSSSLRYYVLLVPNFRAFLRIRSSVRPSYTSFVF